MIKFKYSDLSDGSTMAYKTFDRHYKSFEARRKQLEREESIMLGLTAKMQELGEITYEQYNAVIAWMIHSNKSWFEIMEEVFENNKFPSIYEKQGVDKQLQVCYNKFIKRKELIQMTRTYLIDYASISPDTMVDAIEYAFPKASAIWTDIDEDSFEVEVIGEFDAEVLDEVMEPHLYTHPADWDDCDYECGFDPYMGCFTDDC